MFFHKNGKDNFDSYWTSIFKKFFLELFFFATKNINKIRIFHEELFLTDNMIFLQNFPHHFSCH